MRTCLLWGLLLLLALPMTWAQSVLDDVTARLGAITNTDAGQWRFQHPAQPGGEAPGLDDSAWPLVKPEHSWEGANTAAWYRQRITVPQAVGGVSVSGSRLILRCSVDDDMEIYVDGTLKGRFHWDQGLVVLTDNAQPGESFLVAIKAINQGGPGRLMAASLTYDQFAEAREDATLLQGRLQLCRRLLDVPRIADRRAEYAAVLDKAAGQVDFDAVARRDIPAFQRSIAAATDTLEPFAKLSKEYTEYLVGHAHIDMNWLWLWPETKDVCRATWRQALKFKGEFPQFKFSQSQPGAYIAIEEETPELFAQIQEAVKAGWWEPTGAGWVENDMNMASGEALARHCLLTNAYYLSRFGKTSDTAWCPDTFGHAWTVPSILADAGYRNYYFCRCGPGQPTFWWEGPDGARLLAYQFAGWYSEKVRPDRGHFPLDQERLNGIPAAMLVYGVGDHGGGPTREDLTWAMRLQQEPIFPKLQLATTDEYYDAARSAPSAQIPTVRNELNTVFEGCYTSHADIKRWNRESENLLPTAETLAAIAAYWGAQYPAEDLTAAWRNTLFNQFHDIFDGTAIHGSYDYSRELYQQARKVADSTIATSLDTLTAQMDTRGPGQAFVVWNPVAWPRREIVELPITTPRECWGAQVRDGDGRELPCQVVNSSAREGGCDTTVAVLVDLPATGYQVLHVRPDLSADTMPEPLTTEENRQILAGLQSGVRLDWVGQPLPPTTFRLQLLHEAPRGMSAWNIGTITGQQDLAPQSVERICTGPLFTRWRLQYAYGKSTFAVTQTVFATTPRVDFDMLANWQEVGNAKDGGSFLKAAFDTGAAQPRPTYEIPWGSIERDANGREVPGQKWADLADTVRVLEPGGRTPKAIDLRPFFNEDAIAAPDGSEDGDFDYGRRAYPATIFGTAGDMLEVEGVPFFRPSVEPGALNSLHAVGQKLEWAPERTGGLAVLGASTNGRHGGSARLLYADGTEENVILRLSDWCLQPAAGEVPACHADYRVVEGARADTPTNIWMTRLPVDRTRPLRGIILPDDRNLHIMGLAFADPATVRPLWGVALLNDCKYGFDARAGTLRMSLLRTSFEPDPTPDQGTHRIRWSVIPHTGDWRNAQIPRRAYEFNNPPIVRPVEAHPGTLPGAYSFLSVQPEAMILSAFKRAEDGQGYVARVYNSCGVGGLATLRCNLPFNGAQACNLLETARDTNTATASGPVVTLDLAGRLHGTVRLEP